MKACLLAVLFSFPALAAPEVPTPTAGTYAFRGEFTVMMKLRYQLVWVGTPEGVQEVSDRVDAGEECWNKGADIYQCKAFESLDGAVDEVRSRVEGGLANKSLVLGKVRSKPGLISRGDDVAEYSVIQNATFRGKTYDHYRLVYNSSGWSLRLGDVTEAQFSVGPAGELDLVDEFAVTTDRFQFSDYLVSAPFRRM